MVKYFFCLACCIFQNEISCLKALKYRAFFARVLYGILVLVVRMLLLLLLLLLLFVVAVLGYHICLMYVHVCIDGMLWCWCRLHLVSSTCPQRQQWSRVTGWLSSHTHSRSSGTSRYSMYVTEVCKEKISGTN